MRYLHESQRNHNRTIDRVFRIRLVLHEIELRDAKQQGAQLIEQANKRANQIVDEAKDKAREEGQRLIAGAQAEIEMELQRAKEHLRAQVAAIAVAGAEKILESTIDQAANEELIKKLASEL